MTTVYESEKEFHLENKRQRYLSVITLFVLTGLFLLAIVIFNYFSILFRNLLVLLLIWQGTMILIHSRKKLIEDFQLFVTLTPLIILSPLLMLTIAHHNDLIVYNIVLSVFSIFILLFLSLKQRYNFTLQILFITEYLLVALIHKSFPQLEVYKSGGLILQFLVISLGIAQYRNEADKENLQICRETISRYKKSRLDDSGDPILGIFSKSGGMKVLKQMMKWSERYEIPLTVCYMELHDSHDEYVNTITRGIFKRIRETDTLFRLGQREMLLILPDCQKQNAMDVMKYIKSILEMNNQEKSIKYGLADFKANSINSPNELIINANRASCTA